MTTPERLRRRQRRESAFIAVLAFALCASVVYFDHLDENRSECLSSFIESDNDTSTVRSGLVEAESKATRKVIKAALSAESREGLLAARDEYIASLARIDMGRENNPVERFDPATCGGSLTINEDGDAR